MEIIALAYSQVAMFSSSTGMLNMPEGAGIVHNRNIDTDSW